MSDFVKVKTRTTGFSSPATDYATNRLSLDSHIENPYFTFFFRVGPSINFPRIKSGDVLVVDRKKDPSGGDICLGVNKEKEFALYRHGRGIPEEHWGVVIKIIQEPNG
jgi:SOS-response transcriptional repressor LexA